MDDKELERFMTAVRVVTATLTYEEVCRIFQTVARERQAIERGIVGLPSACKSACAVCGG